MYRVRILISLKQSIADPQGMMIKNSLVALQHDCVQDVRAGKLLELTLNGDIPEENIQKNVDEMCQKFLVNSVIEEYQFEWEKLDDFSQC